MLAEGKLTVLICLAFSLGKYSRGLIISSILTTPLWHRKVVYAIRNNLGNGTLMNPFPMFFCWRVAPLVVLGDLCPRPRFFFLSPPEPSSGLCSWMDSVHKSQGGGSSADGGDLQLSKSVPSSCIQEAVSEGAGSVSTTALRVEQSRWFSKEGTGFENDHPRFNRG